jgi:hypothetical protein
MRHDETESIYPPSTSTSLAQPRIPMSAGSIEFKYGLSFFVLGLLNNVLYVVILSAALDLVDSQATPKVSISF